MTDKMIIKHYYFKKGNHRQILFLYSLSHLQSTYFPFLTVFLPSRGSSMGSILSSKFSIRTVSPQAKALSIVCKNLNIKKTHHETGVRKIY